MKKIFINKNSQLRSGWKIVLALLSTFIFILIFSIISNIIFRNLDYNLSGWSEFISILITSGSFILSAFILWKLLQKRPISELGLTNFKDNYKDFIFGLLFGALSMTIIFIVLFFSGNVSLVNGLSSPNISSVLFTGLIMFILVGFGEEIFFRGYCMSVLKQTNNKWLVILISSIIFSAMHGANPNVRPLAFINIFLVGVLFAYMFIKSSNIWMPIGYHITWNYFQGYIWGFQVSGSETQGLYQTKLLQENLLNGGTFGPEGGMVVTILLLISFIVVREYYKPSSNK
jgi:membrane protease YdiL (CAAX protease family)